MQIVYIDLIPQDEKPIVKLSQYDNDRLVRFMLMENKEAYSLSGNESIDVNIRKPDGNIVVITPTVAANHYVDVLFTEQAAACYGLSVGELSIKENSTIIGTCNFIMDVEKSPTCGGIQSATEIENLQSQVDAITMEYLINNTDEIAEVIANKIYPTLEASGDIATFYTILQLPLVSVTADPLATIITRCGKNLVSDTFVNGLPSTTIGADYDTITPTTRYGYINLDIHDINVTMSMLKAAEYHIEYYTIFGYVADQLSQIIFINNYSGQTCNLSGLDKIRIVIGCQSGYTVENNYGSLAEIQCEVGSDATSYEAYNGITKPIAEATTIPTLTGVNNVFTDYGPVTVEYKYFPDI